MTSSPHQGHRCTVITMRLTSNSGREAYASRSRNTSIKGSRSYPQHRFFLEPQTTAPRRPSSYACALTSFLNSLPYPIKDVSSKTKKAQPKEIVNHSLHHKDATTLPSCGSRVPGIYLLLKTMLLVGKMPLKQLDLLTCTICFTQRKLQLEAEIYRNPNLVSLKTPEFQ